MLVLRVSACLSGIVMLVPVRHWLILIAGATLLGETKAHEPVLVAMRAHAGVAAVQEAACGMLFCMAVNNGE